MFIGKEQLESFATCLDQQLARIPDVSPEVKYTSYYRVLEAEVNAFNTQHTRQPWKAITIADRLDNLAQNRDVVLYEQHDFIKTIEWVLLGRAFLELNRSIILDLCQTGEPTNKSISYWRNVSRSNRAAILYYVQSLPRRLWQDIVIRGYRIIHEKFRMEPHFSLSIHSLRQIVSEAIASSTMDRPKSVSLTSFHKKIQLTAAQNAELLRTVNQVTAGCLGGSISQLYHLSPLEHEWKKSLSSSITSFNAIGKWTQRRLTSNDEPSFSPSESTHSNNKDAIVYQQQLITFIRSTFSGIQHDISIVRQSRQPPTRLEQRWPRTFFFATGSALLLRYTITRRVALKQWILDAGTTIVDFWQNWIFQPLIQIIGTIRHDNDSQIAIMSRQSLKTDMDSLERMVVDFVNDNKQYMLDTDGGMDQVRTSVREGNLSPVLRAYERDLRSPLRSVITGELIRSLLIQVQKTKVDVELAMNGIDRLLKSQQLVFGFVGVTPSLVILWLIFRWAASLSGRHGSVNLTTFKRAVARSLRNMERILLLADNAKLTFDEKGLFAFELYRLDQLQQSSNKAAPSDLAEDLQDLADLSLTVDRQLSVVSRIWRTI